MYIFLPMKDFGIVILSQTRSLTSNPDDGLDNILAILYIGVVIVSLAASPGVWKYVRMKHGIMDNWCRTSKKNMRRGAWYERI